MSKKNVTGKVSWFGGGNDPGNANRTTASGASDSAEGIAVRPGGTYMSGRATLGGYWRVTDLNNGKKHVFKQIDIGPNESTDRVGDFTPKALQKMGYTTDDFPTDSKMRFDFIGFHPTAAQKSGASAVAKLPGATKAPAKGTYSTSTVDSQQFDQAGYEQAQRRSIVAGMLAKNNPRSLLLTTGALSTTAPQASDFLKTVSNEVVKYTKAPAAAAATAAPTASSPAADSTAMSRLLGRMDVIDKKKMPYLWGGGHAGKVVAAKATPLDCSGAVSAALGINPRVSGDLARWGQAGKGKRVTIWANAEHVIMEKDGHFWGTSASNPGGGAGWIPRSQINAAYLSRFTPRHPKGM